MEKVMRGLRALDATEAVAACGHVVCPGLKRMQILIPKADVLDDPKEKVLGMLKNLQETRKRWVTEKRCELLQTRSISLDRFQRAYFDVSI
ncbi:hypothetical protein SISSUDRAFT_1047609 [Sistotremastrum suecicum HHB10207 ss-3]|uniref:Uncharacterized protein n=1 Tax=Sistotremastrum suecicum HHB10207 ss-3 TaxID=1314776 RepID=A0A166D0N4_9AGAM|nr:hypothetical protein SISSUDRAFT_1047609 [Sistotremastrum suecicum HHB10207 ss-3]